MNDCDHSYAVHPMAKYRGCPECLAKRIEELEVSLDCAADHSEFQASRIEELEAEKGDAFTGNELSYWTAQAGMFQDRVKELEARLANEGSMPAVVFKGEDGRMHSVLTPTPTALENHLRWIDRVWADFMRCGVMHAAWSRRWKSAAKWWRKDCNASVDDWVKELKRVDALQAQLDEARRAADYWMKDAAEADRLRRETDDRCATLQAQLDEARLETAEVREMWEASDNSTSAHVSVTQLALQAQLGEARREIEHWKAEHSKRRGETLAALMVETSAQDRAWKVTEQRDAATATLNELHGYVADMVRHIQPDHHCPDAWALRDLILKVESKRDAAAAMADKLARVMEAIAKYSPPEVVKDEFAYDRLLASIHEAAKAALSDFEKWKAGTK